MTPQKIKNVVLTVNYEDGSSKTIGFVDVEFDDSPVVTGQGYTATITGTIAWQNSTPPYAKPTPPLETRPAFYDANVVAEAIRVLRSDAKNDPARRADAIQALDRHWPGWTRVDPEILGFSPYATPLKAGLPDFKKPIDPTKPLTVLGFPRGWNTILYGPRSGPKPGLPEDGFRFVPLEGPKPIKNTVLMSLKDAPQKCVCDIKDLMSSGHSKGCPEKKSK